jgi:hypothetical protein
VGMIALQIVCCAAVAAAGWRAWRQGMGWWLGDVVRALVDPPVPPVDPAYVDELASSFERLALALKTAAEIQAAPSPVEELR